MTLTLAVDWAHEWTPEPDGATFIRTDEEHAFLSFLWDIKLWKCMWSLFLPQKGSTSAGSEESPKLERGRAEK